MGRAKVPAMARANVPILSDRLIRSIRCLGCVAALISSVGCGHPATEADCTLIVDRNVEVQMRAMNIKDPASIKKRQEELRAQMKSEMKDCVGRRVTQRTLTCVQGAETPEAIDDCLR
jgi:hypothetical protein